MSSSRSVSRSMTHFSLLPAAAILAAIVALVAGVPVVQAQTGHFVGAGSSAQFQASGIAADQAAVNECAASYSGCAGGAGNYTLKHWSKKFKASTGDGAKLVDTRHTGIADETGNIWLVWIENSSGNATDYWLEVSVDSTVGVRCTLAKANSSSQGCQADVTSANGTASDDVIPTYLWPDKNTTDAALDLTIISAINAGGGAYVNVGLTDIRAEDAAEATARLLATANASLSGLGDASGTAHIGDAIWTGQGTGTFAQPVSFALPGEKDPFSSLVVPTSFVTYPIGAAPLIFIANNGGVAYTNPTLVTGVTPTTTDTANGQVHPLAKLFDGTTSCDTSNVAFGGSGAGATALTVFERELLSSTGNIAEFSLFRTAGNSTDSQETGWTYPSVEGGAGTTASCAGDGSRSRAIGTSEVVGATASGSTPAYGVLGIANSLGYIVNSWGNLAKFKGSTNFQYFTLDDVDPIFASPTSYGECEVSGVPTGQVCGGNEACSGTATCVPDVGNAAQTVPYCSTNLCTTDIWGSYTDPNGVYTIPAGVSYPNLRNGQYLAWSISRWLAIPNSDPYGPALIAQEAQNYLDGDVADFVPFEACAPGAGDSCFPSNGGTGVVDGLDVYRSHYNTFADVITYKCPAGSTNPDNGAATTANGVDGGNSLGGGKECGGDVGGDIIGPFGDIYPSVTWAKWTSTATLHKGYLLTPIKYAGQAFTTTNPPTGSKVDVWCTDNTGALHEYATTVEINSAGKVYLSIGNPLSTVDQSIPCKVVENVHTPTLAAAPGTAKQKQ